MTRRIFFVCLLVPLMGWGFTSHRAPEDRPPNVILILTDDQGIGDLACHGNPWIKTPNIDKFYEEAVRFTDFHVSPLCTPTRAALLTGQYPINNGAWATFKGRDALSEGTVTMANIFKQNGYTTGLFGKWHLGDNYPVRPIDCGFDIAVHHKAGGVGELSDYWGNNYFDDVYYVNEAPKQFKGYCTDVWFQEAMKFIERSKDKPFFVYLPTNAPHDPFYVADNYATPYKDLVGEKIVSAEFYGMINNIDENFGKLNQFLQDKGIAENTILIYMSDNGSSSGGVSRDGKLGFNMGFRGRKGTLTDGGHRVPFFIRWNKIGIKGGGDLDQTASHIDLLPTLAGLCNITISDNVKLDGLDLSPLLLQKNTKLEDRTIFVHHRQSWRPPLDVNQSCIIKNQWRLINGKELYDIEKDRFQERDLAGQHPKIVEALLSENTNFIKRAKEQRTYHELPVQVIGNEQQQEIKLTIQHAIGEDRGIWKSEQVAAGIKNKNNTHALRVDQEGFYQISCRRWPKECPGPVLGIPSKNPKDWFEYKTISPEKARIKIANQIHEKQVQVNELEVAFKVYLEKGKTFLVNDFIEGEEKYGVYYTYINFLGQ